MIASIHSMHNSSIKSNYLLTSDWVGSRFSRSLSFIYYDMQYYKLILMRWLFFIYFFLTLLIRFDLIANSNLISRSYTVLLLLHSFKLHLYIKKEGKSVAFPNK